MKEVLLSSDSKVLMYAVSDEVAQALEEYCWHFATKWIWENPNGSKLLKEMNGQKVAVYEVADFIDYLNEEICPNQPSYLIKQLEYEDFELPKEYAKYPKFNF